MVQKFPIVKLKKSLTVGDAIKFISSKQAKKIYNLMVKDGENIMVILSSHLSSENNSNKKFQQKYRSFKISVSHTTRTPRSNEIDGVDYHFVSTEQFLELINKKKNFMNMQKFFRIIMEL